MKNSTSTFQFNSHAVAAAKALAILLMVMGHAGCPLYLEDFFYMFHMPVFFILSGYCFKAKYLSDACTFVLKRVIGLWWPFVKWTLFFLVLHDIFVHLNIYNNIYDTDGLFGHLYTRQEWCIIFLKRLCFAGGEPLLMGYWFLKVLFLSSLLGYAVLWIANYLHKQLIIVMMGGGNFNNSSHLCLP